MRFPSTALLLCLCAPALLCAAGSNFHAVDPLTQPGWEHFYNNEYDEAIADFQKEVDAHPDDPEAWNHLAQGILYREMFRNGALESQLVSGTNPFVRRAKMEVPPAVRDRFTAAINKAMSLGEKDLESNPKDIRALYALSVAHGLRANYLFLVEKAWTDALKDATASRKYSNRLLEVDPNFVDAQIVQGLHDYVVGSLPFYMRMFGFLAGFHGDREGGIRDLQRVAQQGVLSKYDARILLAVIYRREHRSQEAIPLLKELSQRFPRNYLFRLEQVQMYSDLGDKQDALRVLAEVQAMKQQGLPGYSNLSVQKIDFLRGNLLFWYDDLDGALTNLQRATANTEQLDLGTAQLAWFRLGQTFDLKGDHKNAIPAYQEAAKLAVQSDIGTEAKGYISSPYRRKLTHGVPENKVQGG
jgi:tetratricopeptide (TPR) repeat protein